MEYTLREIIDKSERAKIHLLKSFNIDDKSRTDLVISYLDNIIEIASKLRGD